MIVHSVRFIISSPSTSSVNKRRKPDVLTIMASVRYTPSIMRILPFVCFLTVSLSAHAQVPNVDTSGLGDSDKAAFANLLQKYPSACGKAQSLETTLTHDPRYNRPVFGARYLVKHSRMRLPPTD